MNKRKDIQITNSKKKIKYEAAEKDKKQVSNLDENILTFDPNVFFQNDSFSQLFTNTPKKNNTETKENFMIDDFSQFYASSQVSRQIDNVINIFDDQNKSNLSNKSSTTVKQISLDEVKETINKIEDIGDINESIANDIEQLFKSTQYKREVDSAFRNLETTICQITNGQDVNLSCVKENKNEESIPDIYTNIKNKLMQNALNKTRVQPVIVNDNANSNLNSYFQELGPFFGLPIKVKELIKQYKEIDNLYEWQDECLKLQAIQQRRNLVYALPTSGGKTLVSEILIFREILCRQRNVIFVLPYVSIVQEKVWALSPFALALDFLVEEYAGGKGGYPPRKRRQKKSVYVATIEKALSLINSLTELDRMHELGLVVVDELHLIGEQGRGATLEIFLTKLMHYNKEEEGGIQIIGMSATIGNLDEICTFLNADVYTKNFRPVELKEYVKCGSQLFVINRHLTKAISTDIEEIIVPNRTIDFPYYTDELRKLDPDQLGGLTLEIIPDGSCLVFCATKKNCENVALLLCRIYNVINRELVEHQRQRKERLFNDLKAESGSICPVLGRTVCFGVAYHHSGLTADERRIIEDAFRAGVLSVICCTSTLAAGVNLPARRVILRSPYVGRAFINLARYKQMAGRAGRAGFGDSSGECILVCENRDLKKVAQLLVAPMDAVESKLIIENGDMKGLRNLILSCIALGTAANRRQLRRIVGVSLFAVQQEKNHPNQAKNKTDKVISELFKLGALQLAGEDDKTTPIKQVNISVLLQQTLVPSNEENAINSSAQTVEIKDDKKKKKKQVVIGSDSRLVISKLGRAAIKGSLDLDTAHLLYEDLTRAQTSLVLLTSLHLFYLITPYDLAHQVNPSLPHYYTIYVQLNARDVRTARILGLNEACEAGLLAGRRVKTVDERVLNRFYLTMMLNELWKGKPVYAVADQFQVSRGLVQQLTANSAAFASNVVRFCEELPEFWAFVDLFRGLGERLQHCVTRELEPLMTLPAVKQGRARQLYRAGYKTVASIARANPKKLVTEIEHMSYRIANQLIASAKLLLLEKVENLREEAEDVLDGIDN